MIMHVLFNGSIAALLAFSVLADDKASVPAKEAEIALTGDGSWDYITVDPAAGRIYLAHGNRIDVVDAKKRERVGQVDGVEGSHGTAIVPQRKRGFATSGKKNKLIVFDLETFKTTNEIPTGDGPDAVLYVSSVDEVWSMNHKGGTITCVNAESLKVTETIEVGGTLEFAVEDPERGEVYVNVEDKNVLAVVDAKKHSVTGKHALSGGEGPAGLAIDRAHHLLFLGCGNKKLVVLDAATGKSIASLDIGEHCDGVAFDPASGNIFASCRGASSVIHESSATAFEPVGTVDGGKTCAVDASTHRLYITSGTRGQADSVRILVYAAK